MSAKQILTSPAGLAALAARLSAWLASLTAVLLAAGLYGALIGAPPDYQQGEGFRVIYVHVPAAWLSLFAYTLMAAAGLVAVVWRLDTAAMVLRACAPVGAWFTALALASGALWGKPMWGTWWVWDARLTAELILLFLYLGVIALDGAIEDRRSGASAAGLLAVVGLVNVPIIHFSVQWWHTLHQGASVSRLAAPAMPAAMLWPLLTMAAAFTSYFLLVLALRLRVAGEER